MDLSIVTSMYCSAPYLEEFYNRICSVAEKISGDFEIIFINDGSPDNSLDIAIYLHNRDKRVRVVDLSRNFGHHKAMMTGLAHARGSLVYLIDCDLEEEPELLKQFHEKIRKSSADVVYGMQQTRKSGYFERISGNIFYWMINLLSSYPIPSNLITARLMTQRYVKSLIAHRDRALFLAGIWAITGYEQIPIVVEKLSRSKSTYTFGRKISILVDSITSFSNKPLVFIFYLGSTIIFLALIPALYLIIRRIFFGVYLSGWPSLIVSIWLLGGLTIFCLGVIGIYLSKIFMESKERPYTIIRKFYTRTEHQDHSA